ncbi:HEAT repeat domain-containing protein [Streptomyces sp. NPDC002917]|uniref:HEAT repeat domain-containing protein n=1 Tax=Streptomyces sp. NPDC002917 TaxID=3364671 RepID=UPI0036B87A0A
MAELASEQGWQRVEEVTEEGSRQILWAVGPGTGLTYIEDPVSRNAYAVLVSEDRETFKAVLEVIQDELMPWGRRALLTSLDEARDALARARAVIRVGLGAPDQFDEDSFTRIQEAFGSPEAWVREAAVWATAYSPWPEYRPLLEATAQSDPDEKLRSDASAVLAGFDSQTV